MPVANTSVTKNGLPGGLAEQLARIDLIRSRELGDGHRRKGLDREPPTSPAAASSPSTIRSGCVADELDLPIGHNDERRQPRHPATEQPEDVKRGAIGQVDVLEDHHRRRAFAQLANELRHNLVRPPPLATNSSSSPPSPRRRQTTGRAVGGEQGLAGAPENTCRAGLLGAEAAHDRRLPDTRLAIDEHQAAALAAHDPSQRRTQRRQESERSSNSLESRDLRAAGP